MSLLAQVESAYNPTCPSSRFPTVEGRHHHDRERAIGTRQPWPRSLPAPPLGVFRVGGHVRGGKAHRKYRMLSAASLKLRLRNIERSRGSPEERLSLLPDGKLLYRLKRRWRDGTTPLIYEPLELMERLAALVHPPRFHIISFCGILAPGASLRPRVAPEAETSNPPPHPGCQAAIEAPATDPAKARRKRGCQPRNYPWAVLMERVFEVDVLSCSRCGGRMRILAAIDSPDAIRKILTCLGLPTRAPPIAPAVSDPDMAFAW